MECKNCGQPITGGTGKWGHYIGPGSIMIRCNPKISGKPYGLNAEPSK
jgi:hypothetical protein